MENGIIKSRKNTGLIIWLVILSLLVVGLGGYVVYDKLLNPKNDTVENSNKNKNDNDSKSQEHKLSDAIKTNLICISEQMEETDGTWNYTFKIGFVNNVFSTYERIYARKYETTSAYNNDKLAYINTKNSYPSITVEFDDNNLIIREFVGFPKYSISDLREEVYKDKTLEEVKSMIESGYYLESSHFIKSICSN